MSFLPLEGFRVLDLTNSLAGPYCTQILAALGAEVVKVEHPQRGDETRQWGPPFWEGEGAIFLAANAGKRSLALDFHSEEGKQVLYALAERADVVVQSLRPGHAEKIGFGAEELRARSPRLVYASIGAFGNAGPQRAKAGYDPLMQAAGGIISVTGEADRPGVRVGVSMIDQTTGMWAAIGILSALWDRDRTGEGRVVDVSLYESAIGLVAYHLVGYLGSGAVPGRHGTAFPLIAPYEAFAASDGEIMILAANDHLFAALCNVIGAPDLPADPRFATNPDRVAHRDELISLLADRFEGESSSTWLERLEAAGVPAAPVHDIAQVATDEQTEALGLLQPLAHSAVQAFQAVALPLSTDGERVRHASAPPTLGEHTAGVLAELGYWAEEMDGLGGLGRRAARERSRAVDLPLERPPEHALQPLRHFDQRVEVDAGFDPLAFEEVDEILGGDVAGRARSVGAAAEPADRGVQHGGARLDRRDRVGVAGVPGVVQVDADRPAAGHPPDEVADLPRRGDADRVREDELRRVEPGAQLRHPSRVDPTLEGAAEGDADGRGHRQLRETEDRLGLRERLVEGHVPVPLVEGLRRGDRAVDPVERRLAQPLVAFQVEDEAGVLGSLAPVDPRHDLLRPRHARHAVVADEADRLDSRQPGRGEPVAQLGAGCGRERFRLVLEPVAGPDVTDGHVSSHCRRNDTVRRTWRR